MRIVVPSGASTTFGISSISESKSATDSGTTRSGGITKGGGVGASISTWAPLPIFNPFMEFFHELRWNHQGVRTKSCGVCKISNISPMRVYKKLMDRCIG